MVTGRGLLLIDCRKSVEQRRKKRRTKGAGDRSSLCRVMLAVVVSVVIRLGKQSLPPSVLLLVIALPASILYSPASTQVLFSWHRPVVSFSSVVGIHSVHLSLVQARHPRSHTPHPSNTPSLPRISQQPLRHAPHLESAPGMVNPPQPTSSYNLARPQASSAAPNPRTSSRYVLLSMLGMDWLSYRACRYCRQRPQEVLVRADWDGYSSYRVRLREEELRVSEARVELGLKGELERRVRATETTTFSMVSLLMVIFLVMRAVGASSPTTPKPVPPAPSIAQLPTVPPCQPSSPACCTLWQPNPTPSQPVPLAQGRQLQFWPGKGRDCTLAQRVGPSGQEQQLLMQVVSGATGTARPGSRPDSERASRKIRGLNIYNGTGKRLWMVLLLTIGS